MPINSQDGTLNPRSECWPRTFSPPVSWVLLARPSWTSRVLLRMYLAYDCIHIPNLNTCIFISTCSYSGKPHQPRRARASEGPRTQIIGFWGPNTMNITVFGDPQGTLNLRLWCMGGPSSYPNLQNYTSVWPRRNPTFRNTL